MSDVPSWPSSLLNSEALWVSHLLQVFQRWRRWWRHLSGQQKQEAELAETWYDPG